MTIPVLPESAPFSVAQRAWLNGFFAGVLSLEVRAISAGSNDGLAAVAASSSADAAVASTPADEEDFPWHDPTLPLTKRLALAEGRPRAQRLMAAMAQLDCGTCGYLCKTYALAISGGTERDLARCTPGGKETARTLKDIMAATMA